MEYACETKVRNVGDLILRLRSDAEVAVTRQDDPTNLLFSVTDK